MCVLMLSFGIAMLAAGAVLIVRFFLAHGAARAELASVTRTETMVLGAVLVSVGFLLTVFGATGTICQRLGIG